MEGYSIGLVKGVDVVSDRIKLEAEEWSELVYSYGSLEGVNDDNIEGAVSVSEYDIRQGPDGEVMGIINTSEEIIKHGGY